MNIATTSVNRPVTIAVISVLLIVVAMVMVPNLSVEQFPDISFPVIMVRTSYMGASPAEVEDSVTKQLEKQLSNVSGLETMTSTSSEGSSMIMLEFGYGRDLDDATNDIRDNLDKVKNALPDDAGSPTIFKFDSSSMPIIRLIMEGNETEATLKLLAEDVVSPHLERVEGVASAEVQGGESRAVRVDLSLNRLAAYGLNATKVTNALAAKNVQLNSGEITVNRVVYDLRVDERFSSLEDIKRTVITTVNTNLNSAKSLNRSTVVRLEDVADVYVGTEDASNVVYVNGRSAIQISVSNESDTNSVKIAEAVKEELESINEDLPAGVSVAVLYDETSFVSSVMNQVYRSAWQGILLAMLVIFLFLRNWRTTLIIGLSLPISIMVTLMFMYFFDLTLNMISLTGLILGLGMIVDNSIVILENIYKYRERGAKLKASAILGSHEMMTAIFASTLTTLSVFIPMIIWKNDLEMMGQMFSDLIFTIVISLTVSLVVAITLVPALGAKFLKIYTPTQRPIKNRLLKFFNNIGEGILKTIGKGYTNALKFALSNRLLVLTFVVVVLFLSLGYFTTSGMNLMPMGDSDDSVSISLSMPVGTSLERTEDVLLQLKDLIMEEVKGYERLIIEAGGGGMSGGGTNSGSIEIMLPQPNEQIDTPKEIQSKLRRFINDFPDADISFSSGRGPISGAAVDVLIHSDDLELAYATATEIRNLIRNEVPLAVDPSTDLDEGVPEYRIKIDEDRSNAYGFTTSEVAKVIDSLVDGSTPTTYWEEGNELNILLQLSEEDRLGLDDLGALFILAADGSKVALSNLASFEESQGAQSITREDETRVVHVTADIVSGSTATEVMAIVEDVVNSKIVLSDGVTISFGGDSKDINQLVGPLLIVAVIAVIMVFAVMASQFESLSDPFIIFFSIPLLVIGVAGIYMITGEQFSLFSIIGMVVLAGIVVNNGIVMVDYTNLLRKRGEPVYDAVIKAGPARLRPILMTSLTTILGMVPLGFFPGEGTEMIRPIGQTIVGGLAGATIITLFVTPIIYTLVNRDRKEKKPAAVQDVETKKLEEVYV